MVVSEWLWVNGWVAGRVVVNGCFVGGVMCCGFCGVFCFVDGGFVGCMIS